MPVSKKIILDTNIFLLYLMGQIAPHKIEKHQRTSIYDISDYKFLIKTMNDFGSGVEPKLVICPNITTEVDNLLNNKFHGADKNKYVDVSRKIYEQSIEVYTKTIEAVRYDTYYKLGITDSIILLMAKNCDLLISGDSQLCDYARSIDIPLLDFKEYVNRKFYK